MLCIIYQTRREQVFKLRRFHYVLNINYQFQFCLCFCFCPIFVLVFVLFGFAQVAGSSFRESAQVSNCLKMWQKHKLRHHSATALPGREVQSLRFVDLLPHSKHFYSNTTKASKSSRQENKTSLQKSKEPWTQSIKIGNKSNILIQLKWSHMISPLKE